MWSGSRRAILSGALFGAFFYRVMGINLLSSRYPLLPQKIPRSGNLVESHIVRLVIKFPAQSSARDYLNCYTEFVNEGALRRAEFGWVNQLIDRSNLEINASSTILTYEFFDRQRKAIFLSKINSMSRADRWIDSSKARDMGYQFLILS